jgi:hypothetical protein
VYDNKRLTDDEIVSLIRIEADQATSYQTSQIQQDRIDASKYYNAEPFGDELEERSKVVTTEVRDTIESILPQLVKIFLGTDRIVKFEPTSEEDEESADQATDYIGYVMQRDNDAFMLFYTFFKDALLNKNGIVKSYWDETETTVEETYRCLLDIELKALLNDDAVEATALESYEENLPAGVDQMGMPQEPVPTTLYNVTIKRTDKRGKARCVPVPPDEFLLSSRSCSIKEARFCAHQPPTTISDLIEMGFKRADVWDLVGEEEFQQAAERQQRYAEDGNTLADSDAVQHALINVKYSEVYMLMDTDGDGIAERWLFKCAGSQYKLLKKERFDDPWPFSSVTSVPMPHKFFGKSVFDLVKDIQRIKSTLTRAFLDNLYLINNNRTVVQEGQVNLDDLLTVRPGGIIRTTGIPGQTVVPLMPQPIGALSIEALNYFDTVNENRMGITKYNQGLDANSLNKTASGISQIMSAAQERILLIARIFAETGVSDVFRQLLRLTIRHQDKPRTIQLRNKWVPIDPSKWNAEMETSVDVALGTQNAQVMTAMLMQILGIQREGMAAGAPIVTWDNIYNTLAKLIETAGLKNVAAYFTDPQQAQQQPQQQGPEATLAAAQLESEKIKAQSAQQQQAMKNAADEKKGVLSLVEKRMEIQSREKIAAEQIAAGFVKDAMGAGQETAAAETKDSGKRSKPKRMNIVRNPTTGEMEFVDFIYDEAMGEGTQRKTIQRNPRTGETRLIDQAETIGPDGRLAALNVP